MKSQKKEKKIIVLDEGIKTDTSGDPIHAQKICCWGLFVPFR